MQEQLKQLIKTKDQIQVKIMGLDAEIKAINDAKHLQKGLVDAEGFPRADLDFGEIANYRTLKKRRAELNTDHCAIMKDIEKRLHALHQTFPDIDEQNNEQCRKQQQKQISFKKREAPQKTQVIEQKQQITIDYLTPFGQISSIQTESPAFKYGIRKDDLLSQFSEITIYTVDNIKQIPKYVKEGQKLMIVVLRMVELVSKESEQQLKKQDIHLLKNGKYYKKIKCEVIPEKWTGRGLLGCKIDPIQ